MIEIMCGSSPEIERFLRNLLLFTINFHIGWEKETLDQFQLLNPSEKDVETCKSYIEYLNQYKNVSFARHFLNDLPPIEHIVHDRIKTWSCNGTGDIPCQYNNGPACCTVEWCGLGDCPFGEGFAELDRDWVASVKKEFALCHPSSDEEQELQEFFNRADALIKENAKEENAKIKKRWREVFEGKEKKEEGA